MEQTHPNESRQIDKKDRYLCGSIICVNTGVKKLNNLAI